MADRMSPLRPGPIYSPKKLERTHQIEPQLVEQLDYSMAASMGAESQDVAPLNAHMLARHAHMHAYMRLCTALMHAYTCMHARTHTCMRACQHAHTQGMHRTHSIHGMRKHKQAHDLHEMRRQQQAARLNESQGFLSDTLHSTGLQSHLSESYGDVESSLDRSHQPSQPDMPDGIVPAASQLDELDELTRQIRAETETSRYCPKDIVKCKDSRHDVCGCRWLGTGMVTSKFTGVRSFAPDRHRRSAPQHAAM